MTGLLSDHLFSEALECPIRFGFTQAAAKAITADLPLKWQTRRVLRKIFCRSLPVPNLTTTLSTSPDELAHWARSPDPGVICDLHVRHDPYVTRIPILYRLPGQPLRIAQLQGKRWNPARDRLTDRHLRHPLYRRYFFQLAYRRMVFEKAFGICGIDLGIVFPASTFRAPVQGLFDLATGRGADAGSDGLQVLDGAFTWVEATAWVDSVHQGRFDPVRPLVPPSAEASSALTDWDAWITGLALSVVDGTTTPSGAPAAAPAAPPIGSAPPGAKHAAATAAAGTDAPPGAKHAAVSISTTPGAPAAAATAAAGTDAPSGAKHAAATAAAPIGSAPSAPAAPPIGSAPPAVAAGTDAPPGAKHAAVSTSTTPTVAPPIGSAPPVAAGTDAPPGAKQAAVSTSTTPPGAPAAAATAAAPIGSAPPGAAGTDAPPGAADEARPTAPFAHSAAVFRPGRACVRCRYRRTGPDPEPGCWERHLGQGLRRPDLHVPDLPGHGNDALLQQGAYFMESLSHADVPEAEDEPQSFSLQWRRSVLVESAKLGSPRPETLHPTLCENLSKLVYPLHFIDFEACTFPVPLNRGGRMHDTLVFQYSCHTVQRPGPLREAGIRHHHWIDSGFSPDPERRFADSLASIPEIESGTVVHFAPFEPQHLTTVARRLAAGGSAGSGASDGNGSGIGENGLLAAALAGPAAKGRFLDVAAWLREGYHHPELQGGLGLKDLARALATVPHVRQEWKALSAAQTGLGQQDIQDLILGGDSEGFTEGEEAMHAYLLMRAGEVPEDRIPRWTEDLVRYCALDTMAMVLAVRHWQWLCERMPGKENDLP